MSFFCYSISLDRGSSIIIYHHGSDSRERKIIILWDFEPTTKYFLFFVNLRSQQLHFLFTPYFIQLIIIIKVAITQRE